MLPAELLAHVDEMTEIQTQRLALLATEDVPACIRAQLRIAAAYTRIAAKEREAALALMRSPGLEGTFAAELAALKTTFDQALDQAQRLAAAWAALSDCPVPPQHLSAVVRQALSAEGLSKSGYAQLCGLSPATASRHLADMLAAGCVRQQGRGPATRYFAVDR